MRYHCRLVLSLGAWLAIGPTLVLACDGRCFEEAAADVHEIHAAVDEHAASPCHTDNPAQPRPAPVPCSHDADTELTIALRPSNGGTSLVPLDRSGLLPSSTVSLDRRDFRGAFTTYSSLGVLLFPSTLQVVLRI